MNILKKSVLILSLILLTGCEDELAQLGFSEPVIIETTVNTADVPEDELYGGIVDSLENMEMISTYSREIDSDTVSRTIERIRQEHPEFFWINGYTLTTSAVKSEIRINVTDNYSSAELESMYAELIECADRLVNQIPQGLDDYGKVVFVHDYIINNTTYDTAGAETDDKGLWCTAYGCLVQGSAICQGYAEAFQYIMNRLGIEGGICRGNSTQGRHAWNYVLLNGKYYWIDVTWDDPVPEQGRTETLLHTYCLINDECLFRTRFADDDLLFVPQCYSMDNNYFVRNGTYLAYYSDEGISAILRNYAQAGEVEIMFADKNSYNEAVERLFVNGDIWNFVDSEEVTYSNDDIMYILTIKY
ncbi:MAG: hypothetical protein NC340_02440 [Ruminococcus flavefaciens]|nr:hypothetical protein [Ruminococcus flavefaciens]MCM1229332.1 hypothetical protein [Ruminococcus flavefaciens]